MKRAIYPGSFNPFTKGHLNILNKALQIFDEVIVVFAQNPDKKIKDWDPVLAKQQIDALNAIPGVKVVRTDKLTVDIARQFGAKFIVRGIRNSTDYEYESQLLSYNKLIDPSVETVFLTADKEFENISSSFVRELRRYNKDYSQFIL